MVKHILDRLRKGYWHRRIWFSNLPKDQRGYIVQMWVLGAFGLGTFIFVVTLASQLSGLWHFASIMGGIAVLAYFWVTSILHYAFYLESRIKALEANKNG